MYTSTPIGDKTADPGELAPQIYYLTDEKVKLKKFGRLYLAEQLPNY